MRSRFLEERAQRMARDPDCCGPGGAPHRRLSPEERQRLREQVRESNRGLDPAAAGAAPPRR
jgi:hypothetical protein